jgi:hypothetical protein
VASIVIHRGRALPIGDRLGAGSSPASLQDSPPVSGKNEELSDRGSGLSFTVGVAEHLSSTFVNLSLPSLSPPTWVPKRSENREEMVWMYGDRS